MVEPTRSFIGKAPHEQMGRRLFVQLGGLTAAGNQHTDCSAPNGDDLARLRTHTA